MVATGGECCDADRFDQCVRIVLDQGAVLERARFGLVGVAHQVVRRRLLRADRFPLATGREAGAAAAGEARGGDRLDHPFGAHVASHRQCVEAAIGQIGVEVGRILASGAAQQHEGIVAGLRDARRRRRFRARPLAADPRIDLDGRDVSGHGLPDRFAGVDHECGRCPLAQAEAGRRVGARRQIGLGRAAVGPTGEIDADVGLVRRALRESEQCVERSPRRTPRRGRDRAVRRCGRSRSG